jgi:hypothetical protein
MLHQHHHRRPWRATAHADWYWASLSLKPGIRRVLYLAAPVPIQYYTSSDPTINTRPPSPAPTAGRQSAHCLTLQQCPLLMVRGVCRPCKIASSLFLGSVCVCIHYVTLARVLLQCSRVQYLAQPSPKGRSAADHPKSAAQWAPCFAKPCRADIAMAMSNDSQC